jgi:hypothetical protein
VEIKEKSLKIIEKEHAGSRFGNGNYTYFRITE